MDQRSRYAPPTSAVVAERVAGWDGKYFLLTSPGTLPCLCVECGADQALTTRTAKLRYVNPATFLWFFLSPVILLIAYLVVLKRATVSYSQCASCLSTTRRWAAVMKISGLAFCLAVAGRIGLDGEQTVAPLIAAMLVSFLVFIVAAAMKGPKLAIRKVRAGVFYIGGMKKAFTRQMVG
jgi:hypothetical protein